MNIFEAFAAELHDLVDPLKGVLSPLAFELVTRLIDHNEGGEAMVLLARAIVEDDIHLPRAVINQIHEMADGLIDPRELPADLDAQPIPENT
jgi:hypothetical protein